MIGIHKKFKTSVMASMKVNRHDVSRWGIYNIKKKIDKNNFTINNVVEKPTIKASPSNNAVIGRYILPKSIFSKLNIDKITEQEIDLYFKEGVVDLENLNVSYKIKPELYNLAYNMIHRDR